MQVARTAMRPTGFIEACGRGLVSVKSSLGCSLLYRHLKFPLIFNNVMLMLTLFSGFSGGNKWGRFLTRECQSSIIDRGYAALAASAASPFGNYGGSGRMMMTLGRNAEHCVRWSLAQCPVLALR